MDMLNINFLIKNKQTIKYLYLNLTQNDAIKVEKQPPINPSHVFLGDNSINGVLPNVTPNIYANISFVMTKEHGKINHTIPKIYYLLI